MLKGLACLLVANIILGICINTALSNYAKVAIRDLVFSDIYSDDKIKNQGQLEGILSHGFRRDIAGASYDQYLDGEKLTQLKLLQFNKPGDATYLARAIGDLIGPLQASDICGIDGLKETVTSVSRRIGCCSDYARAYIAYANAVHLPVRMSFNADHSSVEYFDRGLGKWVWIDPYLKTQISSESGELLNQYEIRGSKRWEKLKLIDLLPIRTGVEISDFGAYASKSYQYIYWSRGANLIEVEQSNAAMRRFGIGREIRQIILLTLGIQPHHVLLASPRISYNFRVARLLLFCLLIAYVSANLALTIRLFVMVRKSRSSNHS